MEDAKDVEALHAELNNIYERLKEEAIREERGTEI